MCAVLRSLYQRFSGASSSLKLKYDYTPTIGWEGRFDRQPLVDVVFKNPNNGRTVEVRCLIDSGAANTILNAALADELGIDLRTGGQHPFFGISGDPVVGYDHMVSFRLKEDSHEYGMAVAFLPGLNATGLLGREGFFENYKVTFEQAQKRFELTPL